MADIKRISIREFREFGFLQELNRLFLHPLGMALEVEIDDKGGESLGGILDYRNDPEGMIFDFKNLASKRIKDSSEKQKRVEDFRIKKYSARQKLLGYYFEPIEAVSEIKHLP